MTFKEVFSILKNWNIVEIKIKEGYNIRSKNTIYAEWETETTFVQDYYDRVKKFIFTKNNFFLNTNILKAHKKYTTEEINEWLRTQKINNAFMNNSWIYSQIEQIRYKNKIIYQTQITHLDDLITVKFPKTDIFIAYDIVWTFFHNNRISHIKKNTIDISQIDFNDNDFKSLTFRELFDKTQEENNITLKYLNKEFVDLASRIHFYKWY
jgi:hypothetical protein